VIMNIESCSIQLVDDHEMVRKGFKSLIETTTRHTIIVESANGEEAWRHYLKFSPDIVIIDISMPGIGGVEGIKRILSRDSEARIIVLTMIGPEIIPQLINLGVRGYINKASSPKMIIRAIEAVLNGDLFISGEVKPSHQLKEWKNDDNPFNRLSKREFEVLMLLLAEKTNNEIGDILGLSAKTVHVHKNRIFHKLEVSSMVSLTQLASVHHLI